ncbi:hypothetical protein DSCO28_36580 [Desulfosarcina ovata subsp. sediminis]|uniref:Uncharacterized protein n=2 Tax=Desulfosarcina ovata TaxID=83564 RepID=A0A5K7ZSA8_9BACT|nr:hypothetical protein DSCO28_36580 [Desulfosarcina ovata subsp. sediminis]
MQESGAQILKDRNGEIVLIGIAKVFPENYDSSMLPEMIRNGEIRAKVAILELGGNMGISTERGSCEKSSVSNTLSQTMSLSSFYQTTTAQVEGKIKQMPVIGTWWSFNHSTFFVAVGDMMKAKEGSNYIEAPSLAVNVLETKKIIEAQEPFYSLLKASPDLVNNGGARGFILPNGDRVLISVASTKITSDISKARKIARYKAVRTLLGQKEGINVYTTEMLQDIETQIIKGDGLRFEMLEDFLSIQSESVKGKLHALPIVATWIDDNLKSFYVAIGTF